MNFKHIRETIGQHLSSFEANKRFLMVNIGIDVTKDGFCKVRPEERTPSCKINKDGSCHDYGTGEH